MNQGFGHFKHTKLRRHPVKASETKKKGRIGERMRKWRLRERGNRDRKMKWRQRDEMEIER